MMTGTTATTFLARSQKPCPKKEGSGSRCTAGSWPARHSQTATELCKVTLLLGKPARLAQRNRRASNPQLAALPAAWCASHIVAPRHPAHSPCAARMTASATQAATHRKEHRILNMLIGATPPSVLGPAVCVKVYMA